MKSVLNMLSVVVFLVIFSCFAYSQTDPPKSTSRVTVKYDKGKDMTQVSLKPFKIDRYDQEKQMGGNFKPHQMEFDAWFSYKGQATGPIQEVTFRFHCTSNTYIFLHGQEVIVAIDREIKDKDRGFSLGMSEYRSESPKFNTVYEENMTLKVP